MSDDLTQARIEELGRKALAAKTSKERKGFERRQRALKNASKLTDLVLDGSDSGDDKTDWTDLLVSWS